MLVLVGTGCSTEFTSSLTAEEATDQLVFDVGTQVTVRPTIMGVGGMIVGWLGADSDEREVVLTEWVPGESVGLSWSITTEVETEESVAAREAHDTTYAEMPIGEDIPDAPEPEYSDVVQEGTVSTKALDDGATLLMPDMWTQGSAGEVAETLIWLSSAQYEELTSTRKTTLSFGLFDESLAKVEEVGGKLQGYIDQIASIFDDKDATVTEEEVEEEVEIDDDDLTTIEASGDWGSYSLSIDGIRTSVRTIEASNSFGSVTILASPENPIVLEVQLTPLAQGNLEVLTPGGFVDGFAGYEISEITTK
jgi:hypothetical protein